MWIGIVTIILISLIVFFAGMSVGFIISWHKLENKAKTEIENIPDSTSVECASCAHNKEMLKICEKHSALLENHTEEQKVFINGLLRKQHTPHH